MEIFSKNKFFFVVAGLVLALGLGVFCGKILFSAGGISNPRVVTLNGQPIFANDVQGGMSEAEKKGNSYEYTRQLAADLIRQKVTEHLAEKAGLSPQDYIRKIKGEADVKIADGEFNQYLKDNGFERAKLNRQQLDDVKSNLIERRRELYFQDHLKKEIAKQKIEWDKR